MELGKEASDLHVPHGYRKSMISLSEKSLVPTAVTPRRTVHPPKVKVRNHLSNDSGVEMKALEPTAMASSIESGSSTQHDHASRVSAYSSSVYSDHSSATTGAETRSRDSSSGSTAHARSSAATEEQRNSTNESSLKLAHPLEVRHLNVSNNALTQQPLKLFQPTETGLTRNSLALQTETFLMDGSSSESKASSPLSQTQSCNSKSIEKDRQYGTSFEDPISGSSEIMSESRRVGRHTDSHSYVVDHLVAGPFSYSEREGSKTAWIRTKMVSDDSCDKPTLLTRQLSQSIFSAPCHANLVTIFSIKSQQR